MTVKVAKPIKNGHKQGRFCMIEFHFFGMPIKTLGSLGKNRVGRVTGNTHIFFFGLRVRLSLIFHLIMVKFGLGVKEIIMKKYENMLISYDFL